MAKSNRTSGLRAVVLLAGVLLLNACAGDDATDVIADATSSSAVASTADTGTSGTTGTTLSTTVEETTTTADATTTTIQPATTATTDPETTLPGEPIDAFAGAGDVLAVVGVADDDSLNVRAMPGTDQDVVATAGPTADDLVATGRARSLPNSIWYEVTVDGTTGWVSTRFVAFVGGTDDATAEYLADHSAPGAETMTDLGLIVAEDFASEDPPSSIVQSVAPTVGDLGEVTYDVIGLGDDAVAGFRLHIFATEDENGETFTLRTIERTTLCTRGLSGELCA